MSSFQLSLTQAAIKAGCSVEADDPLGIFSHCRFDFTLIFEQLILSAVPAFLTCVVISWHSCASKEKQVVREDDVQGRSKLLLSILLFASQIALLVLWATEYSSGRTDAVFVSAINVLNTTLIIPFTQIKHYRNTRPSTILSIYLLFSSLLDVPQARTLLYFSSYNAIAGIFTVSIVVKLTFLVVESWPKTRFLEDECQGRSPEETSGIISRSFMWWLNALILQGSRGIVVLKNLYELDADLMTEKLNERVQQSWEMQKARSDGGPSRTMFLTAMARCLYRQFSLVVFPRLCLIAFNFAQPFLITRILELLQEEDDMRSRQRGYGLIAATALIYLGIAISSLHSNHNLFRFITMFRGAAVSLIYDHTLQTQSGISSESAAVSLMSTDVDRIIFCFEELNECWSRMIEVGIGIPLLTLQLGWVSIIPLVVIALSSILSSLVAKHIGGYQKLYSQATETRISMTSSVLANMKSLKAMGYSDVVSDLVQNERDKEMKKRQGFLWMMVWVNTVGNIPYVLSPAATFSVYAIQAYLTGRDSLNIVQAFTSLALISLVSDPASRLLHAIPNVASSLGCSDRIQEFLLTQPRNDTRRLITYTDESLALSDGSEHSANKLDSSPGQMSAAVVFKNVTLRARDASDVLFSGLDLIVQRGSIAMITGPVGCGKSTLLKALLGEIVCAEGSISVATKHMAYCSQSPWLPNTTIREAICGYTDADTFDEEWYDTVVEACALQDDIASLDQRSRTVIGSRGGKLSGGQKQRIALARAVYLRASIILLDDIFSALDKRTSDTVAESLFSREGLFRKLDITIILVTHAVQHLSLADVVIVIDPKDKTVKHGSFENGLPAGWVKDIIADRVGESNALENGNKDPLLKEIEDESEELETSIEAQDLARQTGDIEVYKYYLKYVGLWPMLAFLFFVAIHVGSSSFSQLWLKWWADNEGHQMILYIAIYFLLALVYCLGNGGYVWAIGVVIGPSTGRKLHKVLLDTVMQAPQRFFANTDIGSLLNRFSQDMSLIEGQLATGVLITVTNLVGAVIEASFVALGSVYMIFTIPVLMITIYWLQKIYLRTSRQLRFLELESRSPVYTHFTETIEGLTTIRAFGWEHEMAEIAYERIDDSQKPYYLLFCIQRWLALVLDLIVAGMAVTVVTLATSLRGSTSPGLLGVSLNNVLTFSGSLSSFITGWTMLETSLGAISRLRDFQRTTEVEGKPWETHLPPPTWPQSGSITIENATASYNASTVAFRNVSIRIAAGTKVCIAGRTGSGKTSLLSSLLKTIDLEEGSITIDGIDITTIPRTILRQRIITIPQEAFILNTTLRQNLDPYNAASDSQIISALERTNLWSLFESRDGLDTPIQSTTLSAGEAQLLSLVRALLAKNTSSPSCGRLLLLDEPTSSADTSTHETMQSIIKEEFADFTVVTVAHRRDSILQSDIVVVMDAGKIVEVGEPGELRSKEDSALGRLLGTGLH